MLQREAFRAGRLTIERDSTEEKFADLEERTVLEKIGRSWLSSVKWPAMYGVAKTYEAAPGVAEAGKNGGIVHWVGSC